MEAHSGSRATSYEKPGGQPPGDTPAGTTTKTTSGSSTANSTGWYDRLEDRAGEANSAANSAPTEALREAMSRVGELKEFAGYYVAAKWDGIKVSIRNLGIYAALGIVGLIAGSAIITTAAVLLLVGIAWGLGDLLWNQYWLGALLVGLLVLGGIAAGIVLGMKSLTKSSRKKTVEKYENRQRDQRTHYGEDVREAADVTGSGANGSGRN